MRFPAIADVEQGREMASGYEKAACGIDPNTGWGVPTRRDRWLTVLFVVIAVPLVRGGIVLALWRAFAPSG